jgi:hypothetical protein
MEFQNSTFNNEFDLITRDLKEICIRETNAKDNCYIWDIDNVSKCYNSFILSKNTKSKIICIISFHKSSITSKYIPRPTFKRVRLNNEEYQVESKENINIQFTKSDDAIAFWKLIGFLNLFSEIVDIGDLGNSYKLVPRDSFVAEFQKKDKEGKLIDLEELIKLTELTSNDIRFITYEHRKRNVKTFYYLLKNVVDSIEKYRSKFSIPQGDEAIWHHFFKNNDWILGLNADIKFIKDFFDEQKVGIEDSKGKGSPKTDLLGISDFTTIIELKHHNTKIFKTTKGEKSRANTWDFTPDFIEGISQCLGQKFALDKNYENKEFLNDEGKRLRKDLHKTIDPKVVFLMGNRKVEFPHNEDNSNIIKSETFERFKRNSRNIDILTFDELFEKAYNMVFAKKLPNNWHELESLSFDQ